MWYKVDKHSNDEAVAGMSWHDVMKKQASSKVRRR